ncbi:hypothetical protein EVAR_67826_1 [Eumeta japonica]|uniref:Uncharacterized protein n=1 Tax=Eumeta variegata TaxID=151549 RepID=A0A4C1ZY62_EUMVA|nr:hypothetical protein EVAR_67826_1 [Eumeta japonica]
MKELVISKVAALRSDTPPDYDKFPLSNVIPPKRERSVPRLEEQYIDTHTGASLDEARWDSVVPASTTQKSKKSYGTYYWSTLVSLQLAFNLNI